MSGGRRTIVVVAHDVGGGGGMETHLEQKISRMKRDYDVIVVAASLRLADRTGIRFVRIPVIARPAPVKIVLFSILASLRLLTIRRDLLHTTGAIVWNRADLSTVHYCEAGYLKETGGVRSSRNESRLRRWNNAVASRLSRWMEKRIYRPERTRELVAVSSRVKQELLDHFPYDEEQIHVVPNGVDSMRFHPYTSERRQQLRKQEGLPEKGALLLFVGGNWPVKGLELALQAFVLTADELPDTQLVIVGKGDSTLYAQMVPERLSSRIHFVGKRSNPEEWYGVSDLFVFPSSYETFSLAVHEAAAAALAIVTTRVGGVEDLIEDGVNGFLCERSAEPFAAAIRAALLHGSAAGFGERARSKVMRLTWDHSYGELQRLYHQLLHEDKSMTESRDLLFERANSQG